MLWSSVSDYPYTVLALSFFSFDNALMIKMNILFFYFQVNNKGALEAF